MIGGTQRRKEFNCIRRRIRSQKKVYNVEFISKTIRDTSRELHQLLKIDVDSEMEGTFTRYIMRTRRKPLAVVNTEIT